MAGLDPLNLSAALAVRGRRTCRKPSRFAWIHRWRSTTNTGEVLLGVSRPVTWVTYASARFAQSRNSATTAAAPWREMSGPGLTNFLAVFSAIVQSTTEVAMH